jgi:hypothetical protein
MNTFCLLQQKISHSVSLRGQQVDAIFPSGSVPTKFIMCVCVCVCVECVLFLHRYGTNLRHGDQKLFREYCSGSALRFTRVFWNTEERRMQQQYSNEPMRTCNKEDRERETSKL